MQQPPADRWGDGDPYERYVGRWSRRLAPLFLRWLGMERRCTWADVGCGTGALTEAILAGEEPLAVHGIDRSAGFLAAARERTTDARAQFHQADATALPLPDGACDAAVSGLVLNFVPEPARMVAEMRRITRPGGRVAAYVWDYAGGMQMMRIFWDAAVEVAPPGTAPDQAERFPICAPAPLAAAWVAAGLQAVDVQPIEIATEFRSFDDFWTPFLGRQGAAPTYLASLAPAQQESIRAAAARRVPQDASGRIALKALAWAAQGRCPPA